MASWSDLWRLWRRRIKAAAPYVRRREYRVVQDKYARLIDTLDGQASPANTAALDIRQPLPASPEGELCLFVTHAAQPALKSHVRHHVEQLLDAGIRVALVCNTDLAPAAVVIDPAFAQRLSGLLVRANRGYDFGAWSHALSLLDVRRLQRLYWINDSMVGPLDPAAFGRLLDRIRTSPADVIGLTESRGPLPHLQSYFLAFNPGALQHPAFVARMGGLLNLPDKGQVVDVYELRLTGQWRAQGLRVEALFPALFDDPLAADDTATRWEALLDAGFPYLKTRVIQHYPEHPRVLQARMNGKFDAPA